MQDDQLERLTNAVQALTSALTQPEGPQWESFAAWVYRNEAFLTPTGQGDEVSPTWCSTLDGQVLVLRDFLTRMGEDGWAIVGAVPSYTFPLSAHSSGADTYPSHWLYFQRRRR